MVNILPFRHPLLVAEEAAMLDNLTNGRFDMGLGRGLHPPEFEAFGVDQQQSREMFLESFDLIRRIWADETFVHRGKYWTMRKDTPLSPPLVQRPHPPFLVSAQSEESLRWAAQHDIPFAQIDQLADQARRDQALYRDVQVASGHAASPRLYLMREIFVAATDALARASICCSIGSFGTATRNLLAAANCPKATTSGAARHRCCTRWISMRSSRRIW
jgi:alkanesulfonate monooxygenase SsuD/methylene tetrahydromethanopterin reductase-like flavin-dependent oxidoreductase (luciferase family)